MGTQDQNVEFKIITTQYIEETGVNNNVVFFPQRLYRQSRIGTRHARTSFGNVGTYSENEITQNIKNKIHRTISKALEEGQRQERTKMNKNIFKFMGKYRKKKSEGKSILCQITNMCSI